MSGPLHVFPDVVVDRSDAAVNAFRAISCLLIALFLFTCNLSAQTTSIDSLKRELRVQGKVPQMSTLILMSDALALQQQTDSALTYAKRALHLARERDATTEVVRAEYRVGRLYTFKKEDTLALRHVRRGLAMAGDNDIDTLVAQGHVELAHYYLTRDVPRQALEHLDVARGLTDDRSNPGAGIAIYTGMADAYRSLGVYASATEHYLKALRLAEALGREVQAADLFSSIGNVYMRTGDYSDALEYFARAQQTYASHNDQAGMVSSLMNTGVILQKQGKLQEAIDIYYRVLPRTRAMKSLEKEAIATGNIGSTMASQGRLEEGLAYLTKALALKEASGNIKRTLHTLNDIANVKIQLGDARGAREAAEKVISLAPRYEGWDQLRYGYRYLSRSYNLLADHKRAYHFIEKYNALNDSLFGIEKAQQINELQVRYDTEKKDMAIRSLQQEKQIANAQRNNYILGTGVVTLLLAGLYLHQRQKTKRNQQLLEKEREIDRLKSDFFANISHEFKTPLSLILGPLDTMIAKAVDGQQRFQLDLMKKSASRLLRLINQILELSKLQFIKQQLRASELNVVELIRGVTSTFQSLATSRAIELDLEVEKDEILLYCDQEQIETVCINLISNAFKFTDTGGRITVRLLQPGPDNAEVQVEDNGIGIAREHVDHIFDRFYRVGSSSELHYGGTGIGLALTRELVELHQGTITVESEPGKGTRVTVRLPLGKAHLRENEIVQRQPAQVHAMTTLENFSFGNTTPDAETENARPEMAIVLLIDDNEDIRSYIKSIVSDKYILLEAPDGKEGVRMARAFIPDLIISDVMMPLMDGYEVCKKLKNDEKTSHIPIILLTAKTSVNSRLEGLETEADLYLGKPFVPQELMVCIHNLIQSRRKLRERYNRQVVLKPVDIAITSTDEVFLQRLMKTLEENYADECFSVEQLSSEIGMSRSQLHRKLQALTNESASQFIRNYRLQRAMEFLRKNHGSISEIAFKVGFSSAPYFNRCFLQHYGCTPSAVIGKPADISQEAILP